MKQLEQKEEAAVVAAAKKEAAKLVKAQQVLTKALSTYNSAVVCFKQIVKKANSKLTLTPKEEKKINQMKVVKLGKIKISKKISSETTKILSGLTKKL